RRLPSDRSLAEHVEDRRAALAYGREAALERCRQLAGILHALAVAIDGSGHLLEARRRSQLAQREAAARLGRAGGMDREGPELHRFPLLVVEDDREDRYAVRALHEQARKRLAEEIRPITDGGDHRGVRVPELHTERGAQTEAEPTRVRRRDVALRPRECREAPVQRILVHHHRAVVDDLTDAP